MSTTAPRKNGRPRQGLLVALRIENLAIVDATELPLGPGLTVLTGETGAGKSILVDALSLVLGGRADSDLVRTGAGEAVVEALFDLPVGSAARARFDAAGIAVTSDEVLIRRVVGKSGRGRVSINGQMATVAMLAELTRGLVDVSGQHEHVSLLDTESHLGLVDDFGVHGALLSAFSEIHGEVLSVEGALAAISLDEADKARREDFLRFQLAEIEEVDPQPGELDGLEIERKRLLHATKLAEVTRRSESRVYSGEGALIESLGRVQSELGTLVKLDEKVDPIARSAATALADLEDLAQQLGRYSRGLEADPSRLAEVDERVEALKRLVRKHGGSLDAVVASRAAMAEELDAIVHQDARRTDLATRLETSVAKRAEIAARLGAARSKAAKVLERTVQEELASLSMGGTRVEIALRPSEVMTARGGERAEILFAPNPGEPLRALAKTASGGELSRVLLAFKRVLSEQDSVGTYVFDEVDSGIGGAVAEVIGRKLKSVARDRQVVCVTHLPQVAAYGDVHLHVRKTASAGRTVSRVVALSQKEVVEELARMLGGVEITAKTRKLADEMRARARAEGAPAVRKDPGAAAPVRKELTAVALSRKAPAAPARVGPKAKKADPKKGGRAPIRAVS